MAETPDMAFGNAGRDSDALPVSRLRTLREVNERNREFWLEQSSLTEQRVADEDVLYSAMNDLKSEALRQVPTYSQKNFEEALEIAVASKVRFQRAFSRRGGTARKTDALQKLIFGIVEKTPSLTESQLLKHLRNKNLGEVVTDLDDKHVFFNNRGKEKKASIHGLKDRLSRAKKKIRNEKEFGSR